MALFQHSVQKKYIQSLDPILINKSWIKFQSHFQNIERQKNIKDVRENQYQQGFLTNLFVDVLGYTIYPDVKSNLTAEYKNENNNKRADGAILKDGKTIAVIELKATNTPTLDDIENQAFQYKNNHKDCEYVITSNYEKLRFYISYTGDQVDFNLFTLNIEEFKLLYLCLHKDNIFSNLPQKIKKESITHEVDITKILYSDYSAFKKAIFENIVLLNPQYDTLLLYRKTQKLLDRFLFIFFAEDSLLIPENFIRNGIIKWESRKEDDYYVPLYEDYKKKFNHLDKGYKVNDDNGIFAYNGGLFELDEVLDSLIIDDELLKYHTLKLSDYNYTTDVDVNILGHIFEHSLNEIEEVQSKLEGTVIDKSKTKRKKDGVFYTPTYITKYIVDNTLGTLCEKKKNELGISTDVFVYDKRKDKRNSLLNILSEYRNWLLNIKICDPACGSGAFLNQSLVFLIEEHSRIDELTAKVMDGQITMSYMANKILENNLYGVDVNEESVEIAKLSLWLRTATNRVKLTSLNENIKCGNSIINDISIVGEKAFDWESQFPEVFKNGGFDIIIGNPPYALLQPNNTDINTLTYLKKNFDYADFKIDLFHLFFQLGNKIGKDNSYLGFITPSSLLNNVFVSKLRIWLSNKNLIKRIVVSNEKIFEDADVHTAIYFFQKSNFENDNNTIELSTNLEGVLNGADTYKTIKQKDFNNISGNVWNLLVNNDNYSLINKISSHPILSSIAKINRGLITGDRNKYFSNTKFSELYIPILTGTDINRYYSNEPLEYVFFERPKTSGGCWDKDVHLANHKICVRQIGFQPTATIIENPYAVTGNIFTVMAESLLDEKYILTILNSKVIKYYWQIMFNDFKTTFPQVTIFSLGQVPIPNIPYDEKIIFANYASFLIDNNSVLKSSESKFIKLLQNSFPSLVINKKLNDWASLTFPDFIKEIEKQKIKLSLSDKAEWMQYIDEKKKENQTISLRIKEVERSIEQSIYQLYNLTPEEIEIIKSN